MTPAARRRGRAAEMLLRRDVAEQRAAVPADHGGADGGRDVVVARRNVGGERPERVERRFAAPFELLVMFSWIRCMGMCPGPSFITCTPRAQPAG